MVARRAGKCAAAPARRSSVSSRVVASGVEGQLGAYARGGEDVVVGELMTARARDLCGETLDERQPVEGHGGRAVAPVSAQAVDRATIGS